MRALRGSITAICSNKHPELEMMRKLRKHLYVDLVISKQLDNFENVRHKIHPDDNIRELHGATRTYASLRRQVMQAAEKKTRFSYK